MCTPLRSLHFCRRWVDRERSPGPGFRLFERGREKRRGKKREGEGRREKKRREERRKRKEGREEKEEKRQEKEEKRREKEEKRKRRRTRRGKRQEERRQDKKRRGMEKSIHFRHNFMYLPLLQWRVHACLGHMKDNPQRMQTKGTAKRLA